MNLVTCIVLAFGICVGWVLCGWFHKVFKKKEK